MKIFDELPEVTEDIFVEPEEEEEEEQLPGNLCSFTFSIIFSPLVYHGGFFVFLSQFQIMFQRRE